MIFLLLHYFYLIQSLLTFDTGLNSVWNYQITSGFKCWSSSNLKIQTISFSQQFAHIPQVFLVPEYIDNDVTGPLGGYNITITTITLSDFTIQLECQGMYVHRLNFSWYAYDDQRIQVMNYFGQPPKTKKFSHINPNVNKYFISLLGWTITGLIDFKLQVDSLTTTDVTVSLTDPTGKLANLKQISYQLILGTDEAFSSSSLISSSSAYASSVLNLVNNAKLSLPFVGLTSSCISNCYNSIEFNKVYTYTSTTVFYTINKLNSNVPYTANYHQQIWLVLNFAKIFQCIQCNKVRISRYLNIYNLPTSQFEISILNSKYTSQGTYSNIISDTVLAIPIIIKNYCISSSTIISKLRKCQNCSSDNYYQVKHFCYSEANSVYIESRFIPQTAGNQEIQIIISNNSCKIVQLLYNQIVEQITVLEIQVT